MEAPKSPKPQFPKEVKAYKRVGKVVINGEKMPEIDYTLAVDLRQAAERFFPTGIQFSEKDYCHVRIEGVPIRDVPKDRLAQLVSEFYSHRKTH